MLLVAPHTEASFDAPKRLVAMLGIAAASIAAWGVPHAAVTPPRSRLARLLQILVLVALVGATLAALASPRRALAVDVLRVVLIGALCLPLGASRLLDDGRWRWLVATFLAACAVDATLSLLQAAGLAQPFVLEAVAGRTPTGALLGNEGQLALVLALAVVLAAAVLVAVPASGAARALLVAATLPSLAALLVNRNLTAVLATVAGLAVLAVAVARRRAWVPLVTGLVLVASAAAIVPPLRERVVRLAADARTGAWNDLTSNRLGAWAAALEMIRARPLTGMGPGTFGAEFVPHRLAAELRWRMRLTIPVVTSTFGEAHDDYLQALAELGIPAGLALIAAVALLLGGLARRLDAASPEAAVLLALLVAGAVAALTWFPLQRPATAVPLLLAAGRAWRLLG